MANPTRFVIDQSFTIALAPSVAANLPALRVINPERDTYGVPAGFWLCDVRYGDVITDPTIIGIIVGITGGQNSVVPGVAVPKFTVF